MLNVEHTAVCNTNIYDEILINQRFIFSKKILDYLVIRNNNK